MSTGIEQPPSEVVETARASAAAHQPYVLSGPVEWVRTRAWRAHAAMHPGGRQISDHQEIYLIVLRGELTMTQRPRPQRPEAVRWTATALYVSIPVAGEGARGVAGYGAGVAPIDITGLGPVHRFNLSTGEPVT